MMIVEEGVKRDDEIVGMILELPVLEMILEGETVLLMLDEDSKPHLPNNGWQPAEQ